MYIGIFTKVSRRQSLIKRLANAMMILKVDWELLEMTDFTSNIWPHYILSKDCSLAA